ncbi:hypothetical protein LJR034_005246 [Caballeronia sp. LjRoot34]|uniref:DUF4148 domain-containing protein n=1 Tax=Caballeronia sp. LjRoot34 TaxID=3342325 RepID=UPI003ECDDC48
MRKLRTLTLAAALLGLSVAQTQVVMAQASDTAPASATTKQQQKAQHKAARKARRAKKNADLKQLEKNGYNPTGGRNDYPQDLQNAQKKIDQQKANGTAPASAP